MGEATLNPVAVTMGHKALNFDSEVSSPVCVCLCVGGLGGGLGVCG